jgi:hypothetical protein
MREDRPRAAPPFTTVRIAKCINFPSTYSVSRILSTATA